MPNGDSPSPWVVLKDFDDHKLSVDVTEPPTFLARRYESSSDAAEKFIHDPLSAMMDDANDPDAGDADARAALGRIEADWHVSTLVTNHQATLSIKHLNVLVSSNPGNPSIGIMIVKQRPL